MITIDGSQKSGSGTILRYSISLASLLDEPLRIYNIRAKREKPGLRPQHLKSVLACKEMCNASVKNAEVGSMEITFIPDKTIRGGYYKWDIGTAGSTTMLVMTVLPLAIFADEPTKLRVAGGLFQDFAPSAFHMQHVLLPTLRKMGIEANLRIVRPGYVPKGGGIIEVEVKPVEGKLKPITMLKQGEIKLVEGIALSSHLKGRKVSERMAEACKQELKKAGFNSEIKVVYDTTAIQAGAALGIWTRTTTDCFLGFDQAGKIGRSSESIGKYVAHGFIEDVRSNATVDRFLADQLILYAALADGRTEYVVPRVTDHVETNLWLVEEILGAKTRVEGRRIVIDGIGFERS